MPSQSLADPPKVSFSDCLDQQQLINLAAGLLPRLFLAERSRVFFWSQLEAQTEWREWEIMRRFEEAQSALHEAQIFDAQAWQRLCPRADHGHVLIGPILAQGQLIGALAVTRCQGQPTFTPEDLMSMNRLSLHFSTRWAELDKAPSLRTCPQLTPREREVCALVGEGLSNACIAERLYLSENTVKQKLKLIFRKLGVNSRTQLLKHLLTLAT